jgi:hypothetical protein
MNHPIVADYRKLYPSWSEALAGMARGQWRLFDSQYQAGLRVLDTVLAGFGAKEALPGQAAQTAPPEGPGSPEGVERVALERVRQGLPPPREAYAVPNRNRIDWSLFPDWARPSDPDLFGECPHEG